MLNFSFSIVIPLFNEANGIVELIRELNETLGDKVPDFEIVLVNDGSSDNTGEVIRNLAQSDTKISFVENTQNMGQGYSLMKGITSARFDTIVTMDGDLQVDPQDIEKLLILKSYRPVDFICSKRKKRAGEPMKRHLPSALGNVLISIVFDTDFTDIGSSLKVLSKKDVGQLKPFRNIHRYLSIILFSKGLTYEEVPVTDRRRKHGKSNYNFTKFFKVLWEIAFLKSYLKNLR